MYVTYFKHLFAISQLSKGTGSSCEQGHTLKKKIGGGGGCVLYPGSEYCSVCV